MSLAFEVTPMDVETVCAQMGIKSSDDEIEELHSNLDFDRIEAAALRSTDSDEQCEYAFAEIRVQIAEMRAK